MGIKLQRHPNDALEKKLLFKPSHNLIEKTAGELAAVFYEAGRASGMTSKYKTPRAYAKANLEKFIPKAIEYLLSMLHNPSTPEHMKQQIYDSYIERNNDPDANIMINAAKGNFK